MIHPTSKPYEITVYDVSVTSLHPDGTPKTAIPESTRKLMRFPQEVIDRVQVLTDNVRFRHFVKGSPLTRIDWAWLFVCFETAIPNLVATEMRDASRLDMDQWGFYTFDEVGLERLRDGGLPPDVNLMAFSGLAVAAKAMKYLGAPTLLGDLRLRPDVCYFLFANHSLGPIDVGLCPEAPACPAQPTITH
jgi:hypothetical protein